MEILYAMNIFFQNQALFFRAAYQSSAILISTFDFQGTFSGYIFFKVKTIETHNNNVLYISRFSYSFQLWHKEVVSK